MCRDDDWINHCSVVDVAATTTTQKGCLKEGMVGGFIEDMKRF